MFSSRDPDQKELHFLKDRLLGKRKGAFPLALTL